tara:strand:- start:4193 stop:4504 length:312 start_codon:yes stop_codon:yes gene_type:complete
MLSSKNSTTEKDSVSLTFDGDGAVSFVYEDAERVMGVDIRRLIKMWALTTKRVSHVEPYVADGTEVGWIADMEPVGGPRLGPYSLRSDALTGERAWLRAKKGI